MLQRIIASLLCFLQNFWQKPAWGSFYSPPVTGVKVNPHDTVLNIDGWIAHCCLVRFMQTILVACIIFIFRFLCFWIRLDLPSIFQLSTVENSTIVRNFALSHWLFDFVQIKSTKYCCRFGCKTSLQSRLASPSFTICIVCAARIKTIVESCHFVMSEATA